MARTMPAGIARVSAHASNDDVHVGWDEIPALSAAQCQNSPAANNRRSLHLSTYGTIHLLTCSAFREEGHVHLGVIESRFTST
jgi:hypothetical protein